MRREIKAHTGLRGFAALLVVAYHLQFGGGYKLAIETVTSFFGRFLLVPYAYLQTPWRQRLRHGEAGISGRRRSLAKSDGATVHIGARGGFLFLELVKWKLGLSSNGGGNA